MKESDEDMELKMGPTEDYTQVYIVFQEPLHHLSFTPDQAIIFAQGLMQCVRQIKGRTPKCH